MLVAMRPTTFQQPHHQPHHTNVAVSPSQFRPSSRTDSASISRATSKERRSKRSSPNRKSASNQKAVPSSSSPSLSVSSMKHEKKSAEQPDVVGCSTPGLISLSRPMGVEAKMPSTKPPRKSRAKQSHQQAEGVIESTQGVLDPGVNKSDFSATTLPSDGDLFSRSAPASSRTDKISESEGALTWQQQLMSGNSTAKSKASVGKKGGSRLKVADSLANLDNPNWQQTMFNPASKAKRGTKYDVFADLRDAETFGDGAASDLRRSDSLGNEVKRTNLKKAAPGRSINHLASSSASSMKKDSRDCSSLPTSDSAGDISVEDVFNNHRLASSKSRPSTANNVTNVSGATSNTQRNSLPPQPSTPVKKPQGHPSSSPATISSASTQHLLPPGSRTSGGGDSAYAGPDFHNSPSAASLPAPKFMSQRSSKSALPLQASASSGRLSSRSISSSISSEEENHDKAAGFSAISSLRSLRENVAPPAAHCSSSPGRPDEEGKPLVSNVLSATVASDANASANKSTTIENLLARLMG